MTYKYTGQYLKSRRQDALLSQGDIAKNLKIHNQYVSNWERGLCRPATKHFRKLAMLIGVRKSEFIDVILTDIKVKMKKEMAGLD